MSEKQDDAMRTVKLKKKSLFADPLGQIKQGIKIRKLRKENRLSTTQIIRAPEEAENFYHEFSAKRKSKKTKTSALPELFCELSKATQQYLPFGENLFYEIDECYQDGDITMTNYSHMIIKSPCQKLRYGFLYYDESQDHTTVYAAFKESRSDVGLAKESLDIMAAYLPQLKKEKKNQAYATIDLFQKKANKINTYSLNDIEGFEFHVPISTEKEFFDPLHALLKHWYDQ